MKNEKFITAWPRVWGAQHIPANQNYVVAIGCSAPLPILKLLKEHAEAPFSRFGRNKPPYCLESPSTLSTIVSENIRITANQTPRSKHQHLKSFRPCTSQGHPRMSKCPNYAFANSTIKCRQGRRVFCLPKDMHNRVHFSLLYPSPLYFSSHPPFVFTRHRECCTCQLHHRSILPGAVIRRPTDPISRV